MPKYKIEFDREVCIGALACTAVAEHFWPRSEDGKVDLTGATYNEQTKKWELIIDEKDFQMNRDAADSCPVDAIKVIKLEDESGRGATQEQSQNMEAASSSESTIKENQ